MGVGVGGLRYKANSPARCPNKAKIIFLLCLSAPPSFSNMKRSRYDFSSAAASGPRAHKSDASRKTLRSLLQKKGQIRMIAAAGRRGGAGARLCAGRLLLAPLAGQITLWHRCINTENIASIITVNKSQPAPKNYTNY